MGTMIRIASGLVGRLLFAIPLVMFGISHFTRAGAMAGMVPFPGQIYWVYATGVFLLAGAVGILTDYDRKGPLAAFWTGVLILVFAFIIHLPGIGAGASGSMIAFFKDLGLAGGAFILAGSYKR